MDTQIIQTVAGYIALAVPATVAISNLSKIALEWLNQRHVVKTARIQQTHEITTQYLNRALDPTVPLAIRHQLLRFLSTPDKNGSRLSEWAKLELQRVEILVDDTNRAVAEAENELLAAKTSVEVAAAEKKLSFATSKRQSLLQPPKPPSITPAALRAGLITENDLTGLVMKECDLKGMELPYRKLIGADFSGSTIAHGNFQGSQLQGANFEKTDLTEVLFYECDLRSATFVGAIVQKSRFPKARLEGADFSGTSLHEKMDFKRAIYDAETKWPEGFNPEKCGAIKLST